MFTINLWLYGVAMKLVPCLVLGVVTALLVHEMYKVPNKQKIFARNLSKRFISKLPPPPLLYTHDVLRRRLGPQLFAQLEDQVAAQPVELLKDGARRGGREVLTEPPGSSLLFLASSSLLRHPWC